MPIVSRGAEWFLLVSPAQEGDALLVGHGTPVCAQLMRGMFRSVEIWHTANPGIDRHHESNARHAGTCASRHVQLRRIDEGLATADKKWALIAFLDSVHGSSAALHAAIESAQNYLESDGQCCVVTADRCGIARLGRDGLRAFRYPSARQVTEAMRTAGIERQMVFRPYPEHLRPAEMLGWDNQDAYLSRGVIIRVLQAIGLQSFTFESAVIIGSRKPKRSVLQKIAEMGDRSAAHASIERVSVRGDGTIICMFRPEDSEIRRVLKIPLSESAVQRQKNAWKSAANAIGDQPWLNSFIPNQVSSGKSYGICYFVEDECHGITALDFSDSVENRAKVSRNALEFLLTLAQRTGKRQTGARLSEFISDRYLEPIADYRHRYQVPVEKLTARIADRLRGENLPFVLNHGDFNPGNVFCLPGDGSISGIIDWDASELSGPPLLDLYSFLFGINPNLRRYSLGKRIALCLEGRAWSSAETEYIAEYMAALHADRKIRVDLLMVYWAKHVSTHLKYGFGRLDEAWEQENLQRPLKRMLDFEDS